jgi:hypothetical protein
MPEFLRTDEKPANGASNISMTTVVAISRCSPDRAPSGVRESGVLKVVTAGPADPGLAGSPLDPAHGSVHGTVADAV